MKFDDERNFEAFKEMASRMPPDADVATYKRRAVEPLTEREAFLRRLEFLRPFVDATDPNALSDEQLKVLVAKARRRRAKAGYRYSEAIGLERDHQPVEPDRPQQLYLGLGADGYIEPPKAWQLASNIASALGLGRAFRWFNWRGLEFRSWITWATPTDIVLYVTAGFFVILAIGLMLQGEYSLWLTR